MTQKDSRKLDWQYPPACIFHLDVSRGSKVFAIFSSWYCRSFEICSDDGVVIKHNGVRCPFRCPHHNITGHQFGHHCAHRRPCTVLHVVLFMEFDEVFLKLPRLLIMLSMFLFVLFYFTKINKHNLSSKIIVSIGSPYKHIVVILETIPNF